MKGNKGLLVLLVPEAVFVTKMGNLRKVYSGHQKDKFYSKVIINPQCRGELYMYYSVSPRNYICTAMHNIESRLLEYAQWLLVVASLSTHVDHVTTITVKIQNNSVTMRIPPTFLEIHIPLSVCYSYSEYVFHRELSTSLDIL